MKKKAREGIRVGTLRTGFDCPPYQSEKGGTVRLLSVQWSGQFEHYRNTD